MAWMDYSKEEVGVYHPICEKGLNLALKNLGLDGTYEVLHHQMTGSLEMDYVIRNKVTGKYLCIVEVKRTPAAVNSMRYQYQASSYVENCFAQMEQPFYLLTNLECSYAFRYDSVRRGVASQMLKPGLLKSALFSKTSSETDFLTYLVPHFEGFIKAFVANDYDYLCTLERFESHMLGVRNDDRLWKSSLVMLLYEYIRGAFEGVSRNVRWRPAVAYRDDVELVCREGHKIDFDGIFDYDALHYLKKYPLPPDFLAELYEFGKQNITGESVADVLHLAASRGHEHDGEVPTDSELADIVAVLAKIALEGEALVGNVCDPAAGSGNLLGAAARVFPMEPRQIQGNDINDKLLELLSLRCGLIFPKQIAKGNSPQIDCMNASDFPDGYFDNVQVILMNPPYLSGVHAVERKKPLFERIKKETGKDSGLFSGQAGLECVFTELICVLAKAGTVCACVLPKTHLTARGDDAVAFRRILLDKLGLEYIFDYPRLGLFEEVIKDTCVIVGHVRRPSSVIKFISSTLSISDIDSRRLEKAVSDITVTSGFESIMYGVDARTVDMPEMISQLSAGWKLVSREYEDVTDFISKTMESHAGLIRLGNIDDYSIRFKRGRNNNEGAKELLYIDLNEDLYTEVCGYLGDLAPGMANADSKNTQMNIGDGYCRFLKTEGMLASSIDAVVQVYEKLQNTGKKQSKKVKTKDELLKLLEKEQDYAFAPYNVLIPRAIRRFAQVYFTSKETYVSTNFFCLDMQCERDTVTAATWMSTVFYQLLCEFHQKDQEGARKLERRQIADTYIPVADQISTADYNELLIELNQIKFIDFNDIKARKIDELWARILWGADWENVLEDALLYLNILVMKRKG